MRTLHFPMAAERIILVGEMDWWAGAKREGQAGDQ